MNFQSSINLKNPKIHILLASVAVADLNFPGNYTGLLHVLGLSRQTFGKHTTATDLSSRWDLGVHGSNLGLLLLSRVLVTWVVAFALCKTVREINNGKCWRSGRTGSTRIGIHYLLKTHVYIIPLETTDNFKVDCDLYFIFNLKQTPITFLILKGERNILSLLTLRLNALELIYLCNPKGT